MNEAQVYNVIVADPDVATAIGAELGMSAVEVVTELETPVTAEHIVSRTCEPGARLIERAAEAHERARARAGKVRDFERRGPLDEET
jgi:hypothetical protein